MRLCYKVKALKWLIPMAALSKTKVCDHSFAGIAGSSPARGMDVRLLCLLCCVSKGLCDGLITRPEEPYRVYVSHSVLSDAGLTPVHLQWDR
jgi:hypothetical protein